MGDVELLRSAFAEGSFAELVKERRENEKKLGGELDQATTSEEVDFYDLPGELICAWIDFEGHLPVMTLQGARLFGPGGLDYEVPMILVLVSHVAAWYPG